MESILTSAYSLYLESNCYFVTLYRTDKLTNVIYIAGIKSLVTHPGLT